MELQELIDKLKNWETTQVGQAIAILRERGWLTDGSLHGASLLRANLFRAKLYGANLHRADLSGADLIRADLSGANLSGANLLDVNLSGANLLDVNLSNTHLRGADLHEVGLIRVDLRGANLSEANLSGADLNGADLSSVHLSGADLSGADLSRANLSGANLHGTQFEKAICGYTIFADVDLSAAKGLDTIRHDYRSRIDTHTLFRSSNIPEKFLRGCGVNENLIVHLPSLRDEAIQFYSCFISYSHADKAFAQRLHDKLQGAGIRCWLDEHQLNPGDLLHPTIYGAIRVYDKVLLCCSETALKSWWVEKEFHRAIRKEEDYKANVLVPLNLDGYLFTPACDGWVADEVKQRLAADFTHWKDHDAFEGAVKTVIKALRTDGGNPPPPTPKLKRK